MTTSELSAIKSALKSLDDKNYKKSIKACDQILAKSPDVPELLCIKGSCLYHTGETSEGLVLIRSGLAKNPKSGLNWHLYSIILKAEKQFREALKCTMNAIRLDPMSSSLHRDRMILNIHCREYETAYSISLSTLLSSPASLLNCMYLLNAILLTDRHVLLVILMQHLPSLLDPSSLFTTLFRRQLNPPLRTFPAISVGVDLGDWMALFEEAKYDVFLKETAGTDDRCIQFYRLQAQLRTSPGDCLQSAEFLDAACAHFSCSRDELLKKLGQSQAFPLLFEVAFNQFCYKKETAGASFREILLLFEEAVMDLYEFHGYCLRRPYIKTYNDLFKLPESLLFNDAFLLTTEHYLLEQIAQSKSFQLPQLIKYILLEGSPRLQKIFILAAYWGANHSDDLTSTHFLSKARLSGYQGSFLGTERRDARCTDFGALFQVLPYLTGPLLELAKSEYADCVVESFCHSLLSCKYRSVALLKMNADFFRQFAALNEFFA